MRSKKKRREFIVLKVKGIRQVYNIDSELVFISIEYHMIILYHL